MDSKTAMKIAGAGVAGGVLALAGLNLAGAATGSAQTPTAQEQPGQYGNMPGGMRGGPGAGETALTGETADRVTAAAQAEIPDGTVVRVETDSDGTYEAHVMRADGTPVIVQVDDTFNVTAVLEMPAGGPGGPGGMRGGPHSDEKPLRGAKAKQVTAAAKEAVPNGKLIRVERDEDGVYEAHMIKKNGTMVEVEVNRSFKVTDVHAMHMPGGFGRHGYGAPGETGDTATDTSPA